MSLTVPVRSLTAVLLCTACSASHPGPGAVREGEPPRAAAGYVVGAGGVRLFYRVEGGGPDTVVVLHGGPGLNLEGLRPDLVPLAGHHTLLYFDQRGTGRSAMPDTLQLTAEAMIEDVEALRLAFGLEQLTLLGHSWGSGLAVLYAARYPRRVGRMILVGPAPPRQQPYFDQYAAGLAARYDSAENARDSVLATRQASSQDPYPACRERFRRFLGRVAATPETARRIKGDLCSGTPANVRSMDLVLRRVWASLVPDHPDSVYDWRGLAAQVAARTLVVHGDQDPLPLAGSEEWAHALPNARLVVTPGAGHYPHAEQPERFFPAVEAFLAGEQGEP